MVFMRLLAKMAFFTLNFLMILFILSKYGSEITPVVRYALWAMFLIVILDEVIMKVKEFKLRREKEKKK